MTNMSFALMTAVLTIGVLARAPAAVEQNTATPHQDSTRDAAGLR